VLGILFYEPLNEVHLLQSQLHRVEMLRLAWHVSCPELRGRKRERQEEEEEEEEKEEEEEEEEEGYNRERRR
jgi:ribosomal protein L12E/L44/L45/RPP1/RPP2